MTSAENPRQGLVELAETKTRLESIIRQVEKGMAGFNLLKGVQDTDLNLSLEFLTAERYCSEWGGQSYKAEGSQLPLMVILDQGVLPEAIGQLGIKEFEMTFSETIRDLRIYRNKGSIFTFLFNENNHRHLTLKNLYGSQEYSATNMKGMKGKDFSPTDRISCLSLFYQRKSVNGEVKLKITPLSVELSREQVNWLKNQGQLPSLKELEQKIAGFSQPDSGAKSLDLAQPKMTENPREAFNRLWERIGTFPEVRGDYPSFSALVADTGLQASVQLKRITSEVQNWQERLRNIDGRRLETRYIQIAIPGVAFNDLANNAIKAAGAGEQSVSVNAWLMLADDGTVSKKSWLEWEQDGRPQQREYNLSQEQILKLMAFLHKPARKK